MSDKVVGDVVATYKVVYQPFVGHKIMYLPSGVYHTYNVENARVAIGGTFEHYGDVERYIQNHIEECKKSEKVFYFNLQGQVCDYNGKTMD